jgi:cation diffusion facilitator family transporter
LWRAKGGYGLAMSRQQPDQHSEASKSSLVTVAIAGLANLAIAIAKTVAGVVSGSSAMLSEAAHSFADTLNQVFLLTAIKRSAKPADARHPFGYGMERYFWSLLAAVGIFVLGAGFSVYQGVQAIIEQTKLESLTVTYAVLAVSFLFEGISWARALLQVRGQARQQGTDTLQHIRDVEDPTLKTVVFEDSAALVGLVLAAVGVTLHHVTDQAFWDGATSIAIGLLLIVVAFELGRENKSMLLGQSVDETTREAIRREIQASPGIDEVVELMTMRLAPDELLVAARVDVQDDASGDALERNAEEVERRLREKFPEIRHVFLDPTDAPARTTPLG